MTRHPHHHPCHLPPPSTGARVAFVRTHRRTVCLSVVALSLLCRCFVVALSLLCRCFVVALCRCVARHQVPPRRREPESQCRSVAVSRRRGVSVQCACMNGIVFGLRRCGSLVRLCGHARCALCWRVMGWCVMGWCVMS